MKTKFLVYLIVFMIMGSLSGCAQLPQASTIPPTTVPPTLVPPTATPKPSPWLEGSLIDKDTGAPLGNARIVLCQQQDESTCMVKLDLTVLTDAAGLFKITDVPNGLYAILYNTSGSPFSSDFKDKILDFSPQTSSADPGYGNLNHLMKSLGVTNISLCNAYAEVVSGNLVASGYVYAVSKDIGTFFVKGDMAYATIADAPAKLDLKVWDTQTMDKCEGGEFKPLP